jgi:hypothetical protein
VPAPDTDPFRRDPRTVADLASYAPLALVWVYRTGAWRPGVIEQLSTRAALVRYRTYRGVGTAVDTVTAARYLAHRDRDEDDSARDCSANQP